MTNLHNIEPSGFHKGEYVGYAHGSVYRISRTKSTRYSETWRAERRTGAGPYQLHAATLQSMSVKLETLPNPHRATDAEIREELRNEIANTGDC
jgi:hypothetical protein